jgi:MFS family permease
MKTLTGSNAAADMVFFALIAPGVMAPFGGLLVDRVRHRSLMIILDLLLAGVVSLLLLVHGRDQIWLIYVVAVLYGALGLVFSSAQSALLTVMLPNEMLDEANAVLQIVQQGVRSFRSSR